MSTVLETFLEKVMEPLPSDCLADAEYARLQRKIATERWHRAWRPCYVAERLFEFQRDLQDSEYRDWDLEDFGVSAAIWQCFSRDWTKLRDAYAHALADMILTRAPTKSDSWKRAHSKWSMIPLSPEQIAEAIAADEAFIVALAAHRKGVPVNGERVGLLPPLNPPPRTVGAAGRASTSSIARRSITATTWTPGQWKSSARPRPAPANRCRHDRLRQDQFGRGRRAAVASGAVAA